jgi:hypothetical protein
VEPRATLEHNVPMRDCRNAALFTRAGSLAIVP